MTQTRTGDGPVPAATPPPATRRRWRPSSGLVSGLSLTVGAVLIPVLLYQHLEVYFSIGPYSNVATAAEGTRYVVTTALCGALLLLGTFAAFLGEHVKRATLGVVLLVMALVVAAMFAVPSDRWEREPVRDPGPPGGACYSGGDSHECVGG